MRVVARGLLEVAVGAKGILDDVAKGWMGSRQGYQRFRGGRQSMVVAKLVVAVAIRRVVTKGLHEVT